MAKKTTKPAAKKTATKKPVAKKTTAKAKPKAPAKKSPSVSARKPKGVSATPKRPDPNLPPSKQMIENITNDILFRITALENYAANLRALDRMRHNGVGIRRLGFIEAAFRLSTKFPQYFPHWLDTAKFQRDLDLFNAVRSLVEVCRSLEEKAWNINIEAADMVFTDALEYYAQVKDAAERRIDSAESLYRELKTFFENMGAHETADGAPTQKKVKRDVNALMRGTKDGEVIIKNRKPKLSGGTHEVIDETFKDSASFKESEEGSITE